MKLLNGADLAEFIKERQARAVRGLRQAHDVAPKLAIIRTNPDPVVDSYMRMKQRYGEDILIDVDVHTVEQAQALETIKQLNTDASVHGIIVQIPLPDPGQTDELLNAVDASKDVDGLAAKEEVANGPPNEERAAILVLRHLGNEIERPLLRCRQIDGSWFLSLRE